VLFWNTHYEKPKAAIVVLLRNNELPAMLDTLTIFERRFNQQFDYPYVFLNNEPFTDNFIQRMRAHLPADRRAEFGLIPTEHWSYPPWISQTQARLNMEDMERNQVIYGGSESYRHMCRYQSGFFFRHPLLDEFEYYWRVEPSTRLLCNVIQDPFVEMRRRNAKYGFTLMLYEFMNTIPTLWETTMEYMRKVPRWKRFGMNFPLMSFFQRFNGMHGEYNGCHFWSNFEIASLDWLRSEEYLSYFNYLDQAGGFFYERWGDAPVHSLAAGLFLRKDEVIWFEDIGYFHGPHGHCPADQAKYDALKCDFNVSESHTMTSGSCVPHWLEYEEKTFQFDSVGS
jgi:alpha 1,2-mannosyltransferase